VSTPRTLQLPDGARRVTIQTSRGAFAALEALPGTGVCERSPALLVPGYTGSKEDFLAVIGLLANAGRRVVAIDIRGQYETLAAADAGAYSLAALAADVAVIADAVAAQDAAAGDGQPQLHLMGHSFGGLVAREAVLAGAAKTRSLTLMSSRAYASAPEIQETMAERLSAERVCIPGAVHSPAVEAPETTASTLTRFWNAAEHRARRPNSMIT
jgi:pimeloyl-ACP methyl ester carboxylesterase